MEAQPTLTNNVRLRNNKDKKQNTYKKLLLELCKNKKLNERIGDNLTWKTDLQKLLSSRFFSLLLLFVQIRVNYASI